MLQDEGATAQSRPAPAPWADPVVTALLVLADGTVLEGFGIGQTGVADGEVCELLLILESMNYDLCLIGSELLQRL